MKLFNYVNSRNNPSLVSPWTFIHVLAGVTLFSILKPEMSNKNNFLTCNILHGFYEVGDFLKGADGKRLSDWDDNSRINGIGDTIAFNLGILFAYKTNFNEKNVVTISTLILTLFIVFGNIID
jgi:hypothetical protein